MGRKSALTPEQWIEIERRHLVDGESINSLAKEFGINEAAIRRKINPNKSEAKNGPKPLKILAQEKMAAERQLRNISEEISELPLARQQIVTDLARKLSSISGHLASAAEYGAMTAHRLSGIANAQLDKIDDVDPRQSAETLRDIAVLTDLANESSKIAVNLLRANKETVDDLNKPERARAPSGLSHFYGETDIQADTEPSA